LQLTAAGYVDVNARMGNVFGRSMQSTIPAQLRPVRAEPVFLFAHEASRELADSELGPDLDCYRQQIHQWADSYHQRGWPNNTPRYLGRPYSRMLARICDLPRLVRLVTDSARHERMLTTNLTDAAALAEVVDTQQLLLNAPEPDLAALSLIAVESFQLSLRNAAFPPELLTL
jgi:hypothetical protein